MPQPLRHDMFRDEVSYARVLAFAQACLPPLPETAALGPTPSTSKEWVSPRARFCATPSSA